MSNRHQHHRIPESLFSKMDLIAALVDSFSLGEIDQTIMIVQSLFGRLPFSDHHECMMYILDEVIGEDCCRPELALTLAEYFPRAIVEAGKRHVVNSLLGRYESTEQSDEVLLFQLHWRIRRREANQGDLVLYELLRRIDRRKLSDLEDKVVKSIGSACCESMPFVVRYLERLPKDISKQVRLWIAVNYIELCSINEAELLWAEILWLRQHKPLIFETVLRALVTAKNDNVFFFVLEMANSARLFLARRAVMILEGQERLYVCRESLMDLIAVEGSVAMKAWARWTSSVHRRVS